LLTGTEAVDLAVHGFHEGLYDLDPLDDLVFEDAHTMIHRLLLIFAGLWCLMLPSRNYLVEDHVFIDGLVHPLAELTTRVQTAYSSILKNVRFKVFSTTYIDARICTVTCREESKCRRRSTIVIIDSSSAYGTDTATATDAILARHVHELTCGNVVSQDIRCNWIVWTRPHLNCVEYPSTTPRPIHVCYGSAAGYLQNRDVHQARLLAGMQVRLVDRPRWGMCSP
jgi:hypothetical protein